MSEKERNVVTVERALQLMAAIDAYTFEKPPEDLLIKTVLAQLPNWCSYYNALEKLAGRPMETWYGYNTTRLIMAQEIEKRCPSPPKPKNL